MADPTQAQAACWALKKLGGTAKVEDIRTQIANRWGASHAVTPDHPHLNLLLFRENGRLWVRTDRGTYQLTEEGEAEARAAGALSGPTLDSEW
jgi:hypothetical protein